MGLVERFVHGTFGQRVFVLLCLGALVVTGVIAFRELPIEATYVGARVAMTRDNTVVLSRDPGGTLSLRVEPVTGVA